MNNDGIQSFSTSPLPLNSKNHLDEDDTIICACKSLFRDRSDLNGRELVRKEVASRYRRTRPRIDSYRENASDNFLTMVLNSCFCNPSRIYSPLTPTPQAFRQRSINCAMGSNSLSCIISGTSFFSATMPPAVLPLSSNRAIEAGQILSKADDYNNIKKEFENKIRPCPYIWKSLVGCALSNGNDLNRS